jgi:hypothetical protein
MGTYVDPCELVEMVSAGGLYPGGKGCWVVTWATADERNALHSRIAGREKEDRKQTSAGFPFRARGRSHMRRNFRLIHANTGVKQDTGTAAGVFAFALGADSTGRNLIRLVPEACCVVAVKLR